MDARVYFSISTIGKCDLHSLSDIFVVILHNFLHSADFFKSKETQHCSSQVLQIFDKGDVGVVEHMERPGSSPGSLWKMCRDVKANGQHKGPFAHSTVSNKEKKSHQATPDTGAGSQLGCQDVVKGENT